MILCECRLRSCRRKIDLARHEYAVLTLMGHVVSAECAKRDGRAVIAPYKGYRVVAAQNRGMAVV